MKLDPTQKAAVRAALMRRHLAIRAKSEAEVRLEETKPFAASIQARIAAISAEMLPTTLPTGMERVRQLLAGGKPEMLTREEIAAREDTNRGLIAEREQLTADLGALTQEQARLRAEAAAAWERAGAVQQEVVGLFRDIVRQAYSDAASQFHTEWGGLLNLAAWACRSARIPDGSIDILLGAINLRIYSPVPDPKYSNWNTLPTLLNRFESVANPYGPMFAMLAELTAEEAEGRAAGAGTGAVAKVG